MSKRVIDILLIISFIIFAIILFVVVVSNFTTQMNGLIIIADGLFIIFAMNYLLFKREGS